MRKKANGQIGLWADRLMGKWAYRLISLFFLLAGVAQADNWGSHDYLMAGVYYLVSQEDRDLAEVQFRRAIFSSSFGALAGGSESQDRQVVAEAFYFLGRIYYERASIGGNIPQNIGRAKSYLNKAREYGIVHDRLHPPLLEEINRRYPEVAVLDWEKSAKVAKAVFEIGRGSYRINAVRIGNEGDVAGSKFLTDEMLDLECGARYKMEPDVRGRYGSMYRALVVLGICLAVWLVRG